MTALQGSWTCQGIPPRVTCEAGGRGPKTDSEANAHTNKTGHATWTRWTPTN